MTGRPRVFPEQDRKLAVKFYTRKRWSSREIASIIGCSYRTVINWLRDAGIEPRSRREAAR